MTDLAAAAISGTMCQALAWDCGNGYCKLLTSDGDIIVPSYFYEVPSKGNQYESLGDGAVIEYIEGDCIQLKNTLWLTGETAQIEAPYSYQRIVDDWENKIKYGLQMFLGAIALTPHEDFQSFTVVASIHDALTHGVELKKVLSGKHLVKLNGRVRSIHISSHICEEGVGALTIARAPGQRRVALLDLGHGTSIATVFDGTKQVQGGRKVFNVGVHRLVDAIANNPDTRKYLRKPANNHLISKGLQNNFNYGTTGWCFEEIYKTELKPWMQSCLVPAVKFLESWQEELDAIFCIGGGANLPYVAQLLAKRGVLVVPDAQKANAQGLLQLAQIVMKQSEGRSE